MELGRAILTRMHPVIKGGQFVDEADTFEVRVMAIAEGYAMVRRKNAMPFVCNEKELATVDKEVNQ